MTEIDPNVPDPPRSERPEALPVQDATELVRSLEENVTEVIVGKDDTVEHVIGTIIAGGHLLLDDVPGVGKTMLARAIARSIDSSFSRIQFTPDLLPTDVTGVNIFNQETGEFEFQPGPLFGNVVLGDEINRAPPKTQSALLEAMEENQVTVDRETYPMAEPFTVIATQNAIDRQQTYELPAAQLDRFMTRLSLGYPEAEDESEILDRAAGHHPIEDLSPVASGRDVLQLRETVIQVTVEEPIREYATELATFTRVNGALGVSPRGTIHLIRAAKARAVLEGRGYVVPEDVQTEAPAVLAHRIRAGEDDRIGDENAGELVETALERVLVP